MKVRKKELLKSIFSAEGCNFSICRMPIGANDFAVDLDSLNETAGETNDMHVIQ